MPKRSISTSVDALDKRIRQLENELFIARQTVFHLVDPRAREIFEKMPYSSTPSGVYDWFEKAMGQVVALAEPFAAEDMRTGRSLGQRARCPLCGDSSSDYYNPDNGFAFPEGLLRHLLGGKGANQCGVTIEVLAQARYANAPPAPGEWRPNLSI